MANRIATASIAIAASVLAAFAADAENSQPTAFRVARDAGCTLCHDVESPPRSASQVFPTAPSFEDVACRYRSAPNAATTLSTIVLEGSGPLRRDRHWSGQVAFETMYPNDLMITKAQARQIVDWVLTLCPSTEKTRNRVLK